MKRILGILGGMGTVAGLNLLKTLVEQVQQNGVSEDSDYPEFFYYNLPASGMSEKGIEDESVLRSQLIHAVVRMNQCGCGILVVGCNTAHRFISDLRLHFWGEIVDMVLTALKQADVLSGIGSIGIICSRTARDSGLYSIPASLAGRQVIQTTEEEQKVVDDAIRNVIVGSNPPSLQPLVESMIQKGARAIITGCTEISCLGLKGPVVDAGAEAIKCALAKL